MSSSRNVFHRAESCSTLCLTVLETKRAPQSRDLHIRPVNHNPKDRGFWLTGLMLQSLNALFRFLSVLFHTL